MTDGCPRCSEYTEKGSLYCGACGRPLDPGPSEQNSDRFVKGLLFATAILIALVLLVELIALIINTPGIVGFLSGKVVSFPVLVPFPKVVFTLSGLAAQLYFVVVVVSIIVCAAYAMMKFVKTVQASSDPVVSSEVRSTALSWVGIVVSAMILVNFVIVFIAIMMGEEIVVPPLGDKLEQMFLLADAAFWEELVTRLLYIGVPMTIISLIVTRKRESLKCLFGGFGMSTAAIVLIIVSGVIFGLGHTGWDQLWKIFATGIMGIFLGYVFVRFGLYATILIHFVTNYLSAFDWLGVGGFQIIVTLGLLALGAVALGYVMVKLFRSKDDLNALPLFKNGYIK